MGKVTQDTLDSAYRPFDVVTNDCGHVGFIREVSINNCQDSPMDQVYYSVQWLIGDPNKNAWFRADELKAHCNLFAEIAGATCHPFGNSAMWVRSLWKGKQK